MRVTMWMMAAVLSLSGCAVKGSLSGLTGKKLSDEPQQGDADRRYQGGETEEMAQSREERARERADRFAEREREEHDSDEAARIQFKEMVVVEPAPGMPKVGALDIDWCDLVPESQGDGRGLWRAIHNATEDGWYMQSLVDVATLLCINPTDPQYREQAGYFVQAWVNMSGLPPKQMLA